VQIRTVDLGPFKHRIDDGLELRKAAFECLDILLTALPHVLQQQPAFLAALESGLKDHQDVKAPAHLMLVKLAASPGTGRALPVADAHVCPQVAALQCPVS
jgi:cullin-associated NEDD8-dissociated protein 1